MIILPMNVRGLGGVPKRKSLQRMLKKWKPNLILFQETMMSGKYAYDLLSYFLHGWNFVSIDGQGHLGGLISGWNDLIFIEASTCFTSRILIQGKSKVDQNCFKLLNLYGPYINRREFWDDLRHNDFWSDENLIIGGDLNFIISDSERWGFNSRSDSLASYFCYILEEAHLVDVETIPLKPTWSNRRAGEVGIAK